MLGSFFKIKLLIYYEIIVFIVLRVTFILLLRFKHIVKGIVFLG